MSNTRRIKLIIDESNKHIKSGGRSCGCGGASAKTEENNLIQKEENTIVENKKEENIIVENKPKTINNKTFKFL